MIFHGDCSVATQSGLVFVIEIEHSAAKQPMDAERVSARTAEAFSISFGAGSPSTPDADPASRRGPREKKPFLRSERESGGLSFPWSSMTNCVPNYVVRIDCESISQKQTQKGRAPPGDWTQQDLVHQFASRRMRETKTATWSPQRQSLLVGGLRGPEYPNRMDTPFRGNRE